MKYSNVLYPALGKRCVDIMTVLANLVGRRTSEVKPAHTANIAKSTVDVALPLRCLLVSFNFVLGFANGPLVFQCKAILRH